MTATQERPARSTLVSVRTAARLAGVSPRTIYRRIEDGELFGWRVGHGGPVKVSTTALVELLEPYTQRGDGDE